MQQQAAVLGDPVEHSLSPVIHNAGYEALGLHQWHYSRIRCTAEALPAIVAEHSEYRGFSVTMPNKFAALHFADDVTDRAQLIGSANTLVRTAIGWRADNTDGLGLVGAMKEVELPPSATRAVIVGNGGTSRAALWACSQAGIQHVTVVARSERALELEPLAAALGMSLAWVTFQAPNLMDIAGAADVLISTIPTDALEGYAGYLARAPRIIDCIYHPRPTRLLQAAEKSGAIAVDGLTMLLHQALSQFEQFTGEPAPITPMREALWHAVEK